MANGYRYMDMKLLPADVKERICKKHGIKEVELMSLYHAWWRSAVSVMKRDIGEVTVKEAEIMMPYIGKLEINKKFHKYVQLQRRNAKVQPGDHDSGQAE